MSAKKIRDHGVVRKDCSNVGKARMAGSMVSITSVLILNGISLKRRFS